MCYSYKFECLTFELLLYALETSRSRIRDCGCACRSVCAYVVVVLAAIASALRSRISSNHSHVFIHHTVKSPPSPIRTLSEAQPRPVVVGRRRSSLLDVPVPKAIHPTYSRYVARQKVHTPLLAGSSRNPHSTTPHAHTEGDETCETLSCNAPTLLLQYLPPHTWTLSRR